MTEQTTPTVVDIANYYRDVVAQQASSKTFDKFMTSSAEYFNDFARAVEEDPSFVQRRFQRLLDRQIVEYTVYDLMCSAPLQMQRGLDVKRLAHLWTDPKVSIQKVGCLLKLPTVAVKPDGTRFLVGGNHGLAAIMYPLLMADLDPEVIPQISIDCLQVNVNIDYLTEILQSNLGRKPTSAEVSKKANEILVSYWWADNHTRSMQSGEFQEAEAFRLNVDTSDVDDILKATFGDENKVKRINKQTGFKFLVTLHLLTQTSDENILPVEEVANGSVPVLFNINGADKVLTSNTLESITKAFLTTLEQFHELRTYQDKNGETKERKLFYWKKDTGNPDLFNQFAEYVATNLEAAINSYLQSLAEDDEFRNNVARNAAAIGQSMAQFLEKTSHPEDDPRIEKPKAEKAPKSRAGKRNSFGLTL